MDWVESIFKFANERINIPKWIPDIKKGDAKIGLTCDT